MGLPMDEWAGGDMLQCIYGDKTIGTQLNYRTEYHIVWIPKYRRRILNPGVRGYLRKLFPKILRSLPACEIIAYKTWSEPLRLDTLSLNTPCIPESYSLPVASRIPLEADSPKKNATSSYYTHLQ